MNPYRKTLLLLTCLSGAGIPRGLSAAPSPVATQSQVPTGQAAPLNADTLLSMFLAANPGLRTEGSFVRDWTALNKCGAWSLVANDEFRAGPFLKASAIELAAATRDRPSTVFDVRLDRKFGRYDSASREFALATLDGDAVLPVMTPGFGGVGRGFLYRAECAPTSGLYPVGYEITVDNPQVATGLPMAPDAAADFASARANLQGGRDGHVVVDLKVRLTLGAPHPAVPQPYVRGVVVPVTAHIEDLVVEDGTPQRGQLYRLTAEKRRAGELLASAAKEQVRLEALVKMVDGPNLETQFGLERGGSVVGPDVYRVQSPVAWTKQVGPDGAGYRVALTSSPMTMGLGVSLRFDNVAEIAALGPSPEVQALIEKNRSRLVSLTYVPIGATDDPFKGGRTVIGHVMSVDTDDTDFATGSRRRVSVRVASVPQPWTAPKTDERLSAAFDVIGIHTGMAPGEVVATASSELGQKLAFDDAKGEVRSPAPNCEFDVSRPQALPLGRRCLVANFGHTGAGGTWALMRLQLVQTLATDQEPTVGAAILAKYGNPDLAGAYNPPATLADAEGVQSVPGQAIAWGARLANRRPERDNVPFPLHAFELKSRAANGVTVMTLTALDLAASTAAAEAAAAEAKRAGAAVPTKF